MSDLHDDVADTADVITAAARTLAAKVHRTLDRELARHARSADLHQLVWFATLSGLVVQVFTGTAPTPMAVPLTPATRRRLFDEFLRVTREDFEARLKKLEERSQ